MWTRLKHWSYLARMPGVIRESAGRRRTSRAPEQGPFPDAADNFTRNIERIADVARTLGARLLLSTPPSALLLPDAPRQMPPRGYWVGDAATTQRYRDTLAARLRYVAKKRSAEGQPAEYIAPRLPGRVFLDDVHLTAEGNRGMATAFAKVIRPLLPGKR